jgi:hypothetical protein
MVWLFVIHFGYSWGPCSWIIIAEIWPLSVRAIGTSLGASASMSLINFLRSLGTLLIGGTQTG